MKLYCCIIILDTIKYKIKVCACVFICSLFKTVFIGDCEAGCHGNGQCTKTGCRYVQFNALVIKLFTCKFYQQSCCTSVSRETGAEGNISDPLLHFFPLSQREKSVDMFVHVHVMVLEMNHKFSIDLDTSAYFSYFILKLFVYLLFLLKLTRS